MEPSRTQAGNVLRQARRRAGLTQGALGAVAGIPQSMVSAYECHRRQPSIPTLARLLGATGFAFEIRLVDAAPTGGTPSPGSSDRSTSGGRRTFDVATVAEEVAATFTVARATDSDRLRIVRQLIMDVERRPADERAHLLARAPDLTGDRRWDALVAGVAEELARRHRLRVPPWTAEPARRLEVDWFLSPFPATQPIIRTETPPALAKRRVFLRRSTLEPV